MCICLLRFAATDRWLHLGRVGLWGAGCSIALFVGCQSRLVATAVSGSPAGGPGGAPPPIEVDVAQAINRPVIDYREYTGRTAAINSVDVRARVSGYLLQSPQSESGDRFGSQSTTSAGQTKSPDDDNVVTVRQGELVQQGTLLFQIDPSPYELSLQQSQGSLVAADARLKQANQNLSRYSELLRNEATSAAEYDQAVAAVAELRGQLENLKATVARNQLDLDFTRVRSPITGLLGRTLVTNGNLVVADTSILTTVVSVDPIYVEFDVDEQSVLDYRKRMLQGEVQSSRDVRRPIRLGLSNEEGFPHEGFIDFENNTTDPATGNTRVRGTLANDKQILSPGLFARIQVPFSAEYNAVLIPTVAIAMDQQGRYVMVVDDNNVVQRRSVVLGNIFADMTVIREGLAPGETVVTAGLQKLRPGAAVRVVNPQSVKPVADLGPARMFAVESRA